MTLRNNWSHHVLSVSFLFVPFFLGHAMIFCWLCWNVSLAITAGDSKTVCGYLAVSPTTRNENKKKHRDHKFHVSTSSKYFHGLPYMAVDYIDAVGGWKKSEAVKGKGLWNCRLYRRRRKSVSFQHGSTPTGRVSNPISPRWNKTLPLQTSGKRRME
jgi:hypothetical protein